MSGIGFKAIQDSIVIVRQSFSFKQVKAYVRKGKLYAAVGGGYVKMGADGRTTNPKITWEEVEGCGDIKRDPTSGRDLEYSGDE